MTIANNSGPAEPTVKVSRKKPLGRPADKTRVLEQLINQADAMIAEINRYVTAHADQLDGENVDKGYAYLMAKTLAGRKIAAAVFSAPSAKGGFSVEMEIPHILDVNMGKHTSGVLSPDWSKFQPQPAPNPQITPVPRPLPANVVVGPDGRPEGRIVGALGAAGNDDDDDVGFIDD